MRYAYVQSPSTFPIERRRIYLYPIADVTYKQKEAAFPLLAEALDVIAKRYPDQRILVHTVSYELAAYLAGTITSATTNPCLHEFKRTSTYSRHI